MHDPEDDALIRGILPVLDLDHLHQGVGLMNLHCDRLWTSAGPICGRRVRPRVATTRSLSQRPRDTVTNVHRVVRFGRSRTS